MTQQKNKLNWRSIIKRSSYPIFERRIFLTHYIQILLSQYSFTLHKYIFRKSHFSVEAVQAQHLKTQSASRLPRQVERLVSWQTFTPAIK